MSANDQNHNLPRILLLTCFITFLINKNTKVYDYIKFFIGEKQRFVIIILLLFFFEHNIVMNKQIKIVLINLVIQRLYYNNCRAYTRWSDSNKKLSS